MKQLSEILSSLYETTDFNRILEMSDNVEHAINNPYINEDETEVNEDETEEDVYNEETDSKSEDSTKEQDVNPESSTDNPQEPEDKQIIGSQDVEEVSDLQKDNSKYFFNNIIFFTNERDSSKNKTLKNLEEAIEGQDVEIFTFVAKELEYKSDNNYIEIKDSVTKYTINTQSNTDTIVIVRLGAQDSEECMECIKELQEWGFFVLNPIQAACKASNKYASSVLLDRYNIPQPKFCLLTAKDVKNGQESLNKKLCKIYPKNNIEDEKESKKLEYVVKILNGHGGTGVFMVNGSTILAILQAMFAIDPNRELLLQKKEEADGGDIRVHVLTTRTTQTILASMKRVKISGDFRSNVSLGASAEKVELTKEQEQIALDVAKISGMPWCAVDIMPLVHDSNPEIGDNVVLEYNASPGTDGISEVIGENFCKLLLDAINDINELVLSPKSVGYIEKIKLQMNDDIQIEKVAKLDTGNGAHASTLGCDRIIEDGENLVAIIDGKAFDFKKHGQSNATVGQVVETRNTVIIPCIQIGSRKLLDVEFALVDNRNKSTKVLLNRDVLSKLAYNINPGKKYMLDDEFKSSDYKKHNK